MGHSRSGENYSLIVTAYREWQIINRGQDVDELDWRDFTMEGLGEGILHGFLFYTVLRL